MKMITPSDITNEPTSFTKNLHTNTHSSKIHLVHTFKYAPEMILENASQKLWYDRTILSDHTIYNNRPDVTVWDKQKKKDMAVPNTNNTQTTITEKN